MAGVPVTVTWTAALVPALFAIWFTDVRWALAAASVVFGSVLLHELGHAAAFRAFGVRSKIVLHAMGGVTVGDRAVGHRRGRILVSLAGPFAELLLLGVPAVWALRTMDLDGQAEQFAQITVLVAVGWSLFNLLPILPLDGGHVTEEIADAVTGGRGFVPARVVSILVAGAVAVLALASGWLLVAFFLLAMAWRSVTDLGSRRQQGQFAALLPAHEAYRTGRTADALAQVMPGLDRRQHPEAKAAAVELAAWCALAEDDLTAARTAISHQPAGHDLGGHLRALLVETDRAEQVNATVDAWLGSEPLDGAVYLRWIERLGLAGAVTERLGASRSDTAAHAVLTFQEVLFRNGRFDEAARLGEIRFSTGAEPTTEHAWVVAFNTACSHDRAGRPVDALTWLATAGSIGLPDPDLVDTDPDLAGARALPGYAEVRSRVRAVPAGG